MRAYLNRAGQRETGLRLYPHAERQRERDKRARRLYRNRRGYRPVVRPVVTWLGGDLDYAPANASDYTGPRVA